MKYMVGDPAEIPIAWQMIKPCREPQVAGLQKTAMENTPLKDWWASAGKDEIFGGAGSEDQIAPPENGELLKQELGARVTLALSPGTGHLFLATEPEKTAPRCSHFFVRPFDPRVYRQYPWFAG
jgi:hypothetical protein